MRGMEEEPGTALGTLGWFLGVWLVMMTATMFPSVAPTIALYSQMTKRRSPIAPLGFLLGSWREGLSGAPAMGAKHGALCVGYCWALMASLFALGVMSIAWMAFVAGLIAAEKTFPWGRAVTYGAAAILLALGVLLVAVPHAQSINMRHSGYHAAPHPALRGTRCWSCGVGVGRRV